MKTANKVILSLLCVALLVAASVMGTLAYLTDRASATNTFTVGNVDIKVDEADVDENGVPEEGADRVTTNDYKLVPGQTYTKDPTLTVEATSEASYVRMLVTINTMSDLRAIFGEDFLPQDFVNGWDNTVWPCVGITEDTEADTATYEFRYTGTKQTNGVVQPGAVLEALFTEFSLPGTVTGEQLATISDLEIVVVGHAIQALGFADDAETGVTAQEAAWAAFEAQMNPPAEETPAG